MSRRSLERMLGLIQHASIVDPVGKTAFKFLNYFFMEFARKGLRDKIHPVPQSLRVALQRWLQTPALSRRSSGNIHQYLWTFTRTPSFRDAALILRIQGKCQYCGRRRSPSSNTLELATVYLAITKLRPRGGTHVRIHSDNMSAVHCLRRGDSARPRPLNSWVLSIRVLLERRGLYLSVCHVTGVLNVIAEGLSHRKALDTEWILDGTSFQWICNLGVLPEVDLFATRENTRLSKFVSSALDHQAEVLDAFRIDWNRWKKIYLFPPWTQIPKVLNRLQRSKDKRSWWPRGGQPSIGSRCFKLSRSIHIGSQTHTYPRRWEARISCLYANLTLHLHVWIF